MKATNTNIAVGALAVLLLAAAIYLVANRPDTALGSVARGSEYMATTTAPSTAYGNTIIGDALITDLPGTLGSVVITGANTGIVNFYNATTTNVNLRGGKATSTILIASIPASLAAGTYVIDTYFTDGLYLDLVSGNIPTSTITTRP